MRVEYQPQGVCARQMVFDIEDGVVKNVVIRGGCPGNGLSVARLVEGMDAKEVIRRLDGVRCGFRSTSCGDQLARAVKSAL